VSCFERASQVFVIVGVLIGLGLGIARGHTVLDVLGASLTEAIVGLLLYFVLLILLASSCSLYYSIFPPRKK